MANITVQNRRWAMSKRNCWNFLRRAYRNVRNTDVHYQLQLITQDMDDNKFSDCAFACNAHYLVTNDKHFRILKSIDFPAINTMQQACTESARSWLQAPKPSSSGRKAGPEGMEPQWCAADQPTFFRRIRSRYARLPYLLCTFVGVRIRRVRLGYILRTPAL